MRIHLWFIAVLLAIAITETSAADDPKRSATSIAESQIRALENESWIAWKNHDAAFFERVLSTDHVEVHGYGIVGKQAVVDGVRSPVCVVQSYALGPLAIVAVASGAMLVTYRAEQDTRCGSARVPSPVWVTSLYVERDGRWVNVLFQQTPIV